MFHKNLSGDDLHGSKIVRGEGDPNGVVTSEVAGETYINFSNGDLYSATGVGTVWEIVGRVTISSMNDVDLTDKADNTILVWHENDEVYAHEPLPAGIGYGQLSTLTDVDISNRTDNSFLIWDETENEYIHRTNNAPTAVVYVASNGSDATGTGLYANPYKTIGKALESITDNSSIKRYTIEVEPGTHTVDNSAGPVIIKNFCNIKANGIRSSVLIPQDPTQDMFTGGVFTYINGFVFSGLTGSSFAVTQETAGNLVVQDCVIRDCANGILLNNSVGSVEIKNFVINNPTGTTTAKAIEVRAGSASIGDVLFRSTSKATVGIEIHGATSGASIHNLIAISPNIATALKVYDDSEVIGVGISIGYCTDGIVVYGDNTSLELDATKIIGCFNDGLRIENIGTLTKVALFSTTIRGSARYNVNVLNPTATMIGSGYTEVDKVFFIDGSKLHAYLLDITEDDEGLNVFGELHVGSPARPTESVFGEGDSYTNRMLVYTESNLGVFEDVTADAASASGSAFSFPDVTTNNAIYVASTVTISGEPIQHYGIKTKIGAGVELEIGTGEIVIEYWSGSVWEEVSGMEADSSGKYIPKAEEYFQTDGSNHIRYDAYLKNYGWTVNDPVSLGTSYYWIRFRIKTTIVSVPVIEQIKLHSNRFEVNGDGFTEYFGKARPVGRLPWDIGVLEKAATGPADQDLYLGDTMDVGGKKNRFDNLKLSRIGFKTTLPLDCDTSSPVVFDWCMMTLGATGGNIDWTIRWASVTDGDSIYGAVPGSDPAGMRTYTETLPAPAMNTMKWYRTTLDISDMVSRRETGFPDTIWLTIERDGITDTHTSNIALVNLSANYIKWNDGGHI